MHLGASRISLRIKQRATHTAALHRAQRGLLMAARSTARGCARVLARCRRNNNVNHSARTIGARHRRCIIALPRAALSARMRTRSGAAAALLLRLFARTRAGGLWRRHRDSVA